MKTNLTQAQVQNLFHYEPGTGSFLWRNPPTRHKVTGQPAGGLDKDGYLVLSVGRSLYRAHRVAWLYVNGVWPSQNIDHINGVRHDNRIANLRDVSQVVNCHNHREKSSHNKTSNSIGVSWQESRGRWFASIQVKGKTKTIGRFKTEKEAAAAYWEAKKIHHPTFPCTTSKM